jgi:hypothetical protein
LPIFQFLIFNLFYCRGDPDMRQLALCAFLAVTVAAGCQPAGRYPPVGHPEKKPDEEAKKIFDEDWAWRKPAYPAFDVPIVFIADSDPEWAKLAAFWNIYPVPPAGLPTCHLGQTPLGAVSAMVLVKQKETVKIKVPRDFPIRRPASPAAIHRPWPNGSWGKACFSSRCSSSTHW